MPITVYMLIGCTASGKGKVGLSLAERFDAEIVSVDSMKIYRRMDVGTAKPSAEARSRVSHHMLDVVEPSQPFSLGRYVEGADQAFHAIQSHGKRVLAVGGTMLYVRGLTGGVFEGPGADPSFREQLRKRAAEQGSAVLHAELAEVDPEAAARIHPNDLRRIERGLEVYHATGKPISELQRQWERPNPQYDCRLIGLRRPKDEASRRINARVKRMIDAGLIEEVQSLLAEPEGIGDQAAQAVGYAEIIAYLKGQLSRDDAIERIKINTRRLAKHQRTWMRRIPGIQWLDLADDDTPENVADRAAQIWQLD